MSTPYTVSMKMKHSKTRLLSLILTVLILFPAAITIVNAQINHTVEKNLVNVAEQASERIQSLITSVYTDTNATEKIENCSLSNQFSDNVTRYQSDGLTKLNSAQQALSNSQFESATDLALEALDIFREVYGNLQLILIEAGVNNVSSVNMQELSDAIAREINRISTLKENLPSSTKTEVFSLLDDVNQILLEAKDLLLEDKYAEAKSLFVEAKQNISQIYHLLKDQAEESNSWRVEEYCQKLQTQIQEKFRYGTENGIDFNSAIQSMGYQSENQFMQMLQNRIQTAQSQSNINSILHECESVKEMVQGMEQVLNEEISHHQHGQDGTNGDHGSGGHNLGDSGEGGNTGKGGNG